MTKESENKNMESASSDHEGGAIRVKKLTITSIVAAIVLGCIILLYIFLPAIANKADNEAIIRIPTNATKEMVRDSIAKYLGDKYADKVLLMSKIRRSDLAGRNGAFLIEKGMTPYKAERRLFTGSQHTVNIVVNGARGIDILSQRLASRLDFPADSLKSYLKNPENLKEYSLTPDQALALFIDDTYQVYWNATPKKVTDKIGAHYNKVWNDERKNKAASLGLTPAQVVILASIVDEETNKADEKPNVARLYINRIHKGMKLQADPTVKFALGDFSLRRIRNEHLQVESPYNTYKIDGLPPGPIRTVTVKDIDAVLNSPQHDYIYMCAKEDFSGYHNFAKDYGTHMQNARRYQRALNQRNIK